MSVLCIYTLDKQIKQIKQNEQITSERSERAMFNDKWNIRFLQLAKFIAQWSIDPGCKVGCVIARPDKSICSVGFNGLSQGVEDSYERLNNREKKLNIILHAEENALAFSSDTSHKGYTIITWPFPPCSKCASLIIQKKIQTIIAPDWIPSKWVKSCKEGFELFKEAKKDVILYPKEDTDEGLSNLLEHKIREFISENKRK